MTSELLIAVGRALEEYYAMALLVLLGIAALTLKRRRVLLLALLLALIIVPVLKGVFAQERPCNAGGVSLIDCPSDYGLPSGHSATSVVFVMASLGSQWFLFFAPVAAIASYSRVYLGLHSLEQVAAGVAIGIAIYSFSSALFKMLKKRREARGK